MIFKFITAKQNFMPRPSDDGDGWLLNSDVAARITVRRDDREPSYGVVVPAGSVQFRRLPPPSKARAVTIRARLYALPLSLKEKDDAWLAALHSDGYRRLKLETFKVRLRGYLTKLWRYAKVPA